MTDVVILGTDTDAGKTTFALLWLSLFGDAYDYWKPVETGPSDSERIAALGVTVHAPVCRLEEPVAPPLAARRAGVTIPTAATIAAARPKCGGRSLLIETFGGPFSPLNEDELQIALIQRLALPCVLVSSSSLGAIGRTIAMVAALRVEDIAPAAIVLMGAEDGFAREALAAHLREIPVVALTLPGQWDAEAVRRQALTCEQELRGVQKALTVPPSPLGGEGPGVRGLAPLPGHEAVASDSAPPHPRPLSPKERGVRNEIAARDQTSVWHPYTSLGSTDEPLVCVGAEAEFLHLADGRQVIDAISSWWTIQHGHRHPPLMRALASAAAHVDHVLFAGVTHPAGVELAELLLRTLPWQGGRVFYSDNGSTAVEVALKMAYQFWCHHGEPQRTRFIGFEHGYHGDTFGAMAVSRDPLFFGRFEPLLLQADIVPLDPQRLDEHLRQHASTTAAMIVEPLVQGAGGMRMHTPETLAQLVAVARSHGVLCIIDEVMTGGGRTGTLWAHQAAGIEPDLVCAAKTLAGGVLPLAATLAAPRVVAAFATADPTRTFFHGHSFTAHPLACAVAVENFRGDINDWGQRAQTIEAFWRRELEPLRGRVLDVRYRGIIAAIELDVAGGYLADVGRSLRQRCLRDGVFLRPLGPVLYALPPLGIGEASLGQTAQALRNAVRECVQ